MKKALFATTAASALLVGGIASAQGIALFGDARLGLGYNINNEGGVLTEVQDDGSLDTPDDLRAVSRVRFGVNMTGETDSGITFGATIRADNAVGGQGGAEGQTAGSVFISGSWGTLTYGDTNGADEQWVGDVPGNYSLTGLTDFNETKFVSNGGSFGNDTGNNFASNPFSRPTVRYDFDIAGFGISVSSNRDLTDVGVGAGYAADFGGGSWTVGAGYYKFDSFLDVGDPIIVIDENGDAVVETPTTFFPDGEQWSVGLKADYEAFGFGVTYVKITSNTEAEGDVEVDNLLLGASYSFDAFSVGAFYGYIPSADGPGEGISDEFSAIDGASSYGVSAQYDLGGGASINGGILQTYGGLGDDGEDQATIADFGVKMAF